MKQKVVIRVCMHDQKSRKKALKTVVDHSGVESTAFQGQEKNQIEVIGDGIDAVKLTTKLRKNVGNADIVSVSTVGEKKVDEKKVDEKKVDEKKGSVPKDTAPSQPTVVWTHPYTYNGVPYPIYYEVRDPCYDHPICTIL